jgi:hypothetical protein
MAESTTFLACVCITLQWVQVLLNLGTTMFLKAIVWLVLPFWIGASIVLTIACQAERDGSVLQQRSLDATPLRVRLLQPLPANEAEAFFRLETGADQLTQSRKEVGLMVVIRNGDDEYRQVISSCADPGLGSALGGGTETQLEIALCDGEYWLMSQPGSVSVLRVEKNLAAHEIVRFTLPTGTRAALPKDR